MTISGIALFLLLTQSAIPQQPAASAAPASIEGVVAKAGTGESLAKVTVTLTEVRSPTALAADLQSYAITQNSPEYALLVRSLNQRYSGQPQVVTTTSDGRFLFENLKPGAYELKATLGGYSPAYYGQRGPNGVGMNITLKPGQKMKDASLTMMPGGSITGRVFDGNGEPLSRALVQAHKLVYQERGRSLVTVQAVPTDDRGDYRLFWLPAGKYYISATPSDDRARTMTAMIPTGEAISTLVSLASASVYGAVRDLGFGQINGVMSGVKVNAHTAANGEVIEEAAVQVFYPAVLEWNAATAVEIRPAGLVSGIDIATRLARVYRIRGSILSNSTGKAVAPVDVSLLPRTNTLAAPPNRIPQGSDSSHFEIAGVLPGAYNLITVGSDAPGQSVLGILPVDIQSSNLDNVIVIANPPFGVSGRISTEGTIANSPANRPTYEIRSEPLMAGPVTGSGVRVREDTFFLPATLAGEYRVTVVTPPDSYVKSIRFGAQDVLRDNLHIDGPTSETMEIVVRSNAGRLEGNVSADRQKIPNATVVLVPAPSLRQQTNMYRSVQTNADGHFAFNGIAPGNYKVFAWEDVESFAWLDADFMKTVESRGTDILIREGDRENIEVTVIPR